MKTQESTEQRIQKRLEDELERLKQITSLNLDLKVQWVPCESKFSGEVRDSVIYIYNIREHKALKILQHEFLDYAITQVINPLAELVNLLVKAKDAEVYDTKERLVEKLIKLL